MSKNGPMTILLVEDNRLVALSLRQELEGSGFSVTVAHSGDQALASARAAKPNLILMDANLGKDENDGINVMRQIHDEIGFVDNIYLSGYAMDELSSRAQETSPLGIFDKPVDTDRLVTTIRALWP